MAIVIALQHKPTTAQSLADKFEVSKRTILRDMQSLAEMGIPLYAVPGPAGGFRLMEGYRLPPLQLDAGEAWTVLFALRSLTQMADAPYQQARWTAMDKIVAALPAQMLAQVEPMLAHAEVEVPQRKVKTPHLSALLAHAAESRRIRALYRSERHRRWLELAPRRIYAAHGFWYCEAYSETHGEQRTFRIDRFDEIEVLTGKPSTGLVRKREEQQAGRPAAPVRIVASLTYRGALIAEQDYHIGGAVKQVSEDAWELIFQCPAEEWDWAVRFFYMLGLDADVKDPLTLREELFAMAHRLCDRYRSGRTTSDA